VAVAKEFSDLLSEGGVAVTFQEKGLFSFSVREGKSGNRTRALLFGKAPSPKIHQRPNISQAMKEEEGKKRGTDDHPSPV
jgi:hypothetical protein